MYSDRQIDDWQKADRLTTGEKEALQKKLKRKR
jgi:hypothetical protein